MYISVSRLKAIFTVNSSLSGVIHAPIKNRMSSAVDISALRVEIAYGAEGELLAWFDNTLIIAYVTSSPFDEIKYVHVRRL